MVTQHEVATALPVSALHGMYCARGANDDSQDERSAVESSCISPERLSSPTTASGAERVLETLDGCRPSACPGGRGGCWSYLNPIAASVSGFIK